MDTSLYLDFAKAVAEKAGKIVLGFYGDAGEVVFKPGLDGRPSTVTQADSASEQLIVSQIQEAFPTHGIFGEEGTDIAESDDGYKWYIDPIDGTTNFWRRIPTFGISIGLAYKNKPVVGVLCFPALDLLVWAEEGKGAFANGKRIAVSRRKLDQSLYYMSCREARDGLFYPELAKQAGWVKAIDASSFEFAQIAMGDAELYAYKGITAHDVVAGTVIVREAGGVVTNENGEPWVAGMPIILASNGAIHDDVLRRISSST